MTALKIKPKFLH